MSYHLYHTPALVLAHSPQGEGSNLITLFTREFGLVSAAARSVREERSKLRYGLQDFSYSEVTLVRGKEFWRVTGAVLIENVYTVFRATPDAALMFARAFQLLRRLVAGEEKNERLFNAVREAFLFAKTIRTTNEIRNTKLPPLNPLLEKEGREDEVIAGVEIILVLRILYLLGYLAPRGEFGAVLSDISLWSDSLLSEARTFRSLALAEINHSLRQTQL